MHCPVSLRSAFAIKRGPVRKILFILRERDREGGDILIALLLFEF